METIYCSNCNQILKEGEKFCTQCGTALTKKEVSISEPQQVDTAVNKKGISTRLTKMVIGVVVLVTLFFLGRILLEPSIPKEGVFSESAAVQEILGQWHDPSGAITGSKDDVIVMRKAGLTVVGRDANDKINITLTPVSLNTYYGEVYLLGKYGDFSVNYYKEENKLVFFSTFTKSSWFIIRKVI